MGKQLVDNLPVQVHLSFKNGGSIAKLTKKAKTIEQLKADLRQEYAGKGLVTAVCYQDNGYSKRFSLRV